MKHLIVALAILISLTLPRQAGAEFNPDGWKVRQSRMVLREATVTAVDTQVHIEIYTEPERQSWGRQLAEWTTALVPAFYNRFGAPPGIEKITVVEEPELPGTGWNGRQAGIRLRYPASVYDLARQMAHYWIHPGTAGEAWMVEGLAAWEALQALRAANKDAVADAFFRRFWSLAMSQWAERDFPLAGVDLRAQSPERYEFGRAKAMLFAALLNTHMGNRGYEGWLIDLVGGGKPQDTESVAAVLKKAGKAPGPLLSGWVLPGAYAAYRWSDLADDDSDAVPNALESLLGTNVADPDSDRDGLSDAFEYWARLNPVDRDTVGDGRRDGERVGMAVDGIADDWDARGLAAAFSDAHGDGVAVDSGAAYFAADATALYVRLDLVAPVAANAEYWLSVHIDLDGDRRADIIVAADRSGRTWYVRQRKGAAAPESGETHLGLRFAQGRVVELAIPRELLEGKSQVGVTTRIDTPRGEVAIDHWGGYWHRIDLSAIGVL